ncbi:conserved hypothetical protein [Sulfolobus islandicus Y.G.57.14]|jgi:hypothetical protein|uniref:Uncharacterized protein n=3 Tax=Saccharolobus islandicus TaxID=43080 RepID=C3MJS6_SACI2|nr:hypothetical protein [Sulfolobus islandicus]ACP36229.1 conserved hypothetical protein [Sulfolobus islandicus L.S.2.15]ACP46457.1 conserved hypothetical protein [Sulfolobus islandicus Y.G.57.14]ACP47837.1 conserved hypothetical protein [Sulfolobus islandicus Y.N.15.51]PVU77492.1 hypothetical protein DDW12_06705 [Sulfolobus islandicus]
MDICLKARNDEEVSRALKLNYNCIVYTKPLNNVLTFIPDQYISDIDIFSENTIIITNDVQLINKLKNRNMKIAYRVDKPSMNILEYNYFVIEFIPKNIRDLRFYKGKIYIDNIDNLDTYSKLENLKITGIFTNNLDFIVDVKKLSLYRK